MDNNEELNKYLVTLLKMFKNRPYHLAKYLIDNSALNKEFISKILKSDKLKELSENDDKILNQSSFNDISNMNDFYNSFFDDTKKQKTEKNLEELTKDLNDKLESCIKKEKYEDAARIRDYMIRNGIKKIK